MLTCSMMRFSLTSTVGSLCLCGVCSSVVVLGLSCEVVVVPYVVGAVVAVTVMPCTVVCVVCVFAARLLGCEGDGNAGVGSGGGCGWDECVYVWYNVVQVFWLVQVMSVVRGVGGVCDICMCLARGRGGVEGEWVTGLGLGFSIF